MPFIADSFFARPEQKGLFRMGMVELSQLVAALRDFADAVERGDVAIDEARSIIRAKAEEFIHSTLILRYIEKQK